MVGAAVGLVLALIASRPGLGAPLSMPPIEKASDETVLDNPPSAEPCGFGQMAAGLQMTYGAQMVTSSPRWGRITRADFTVPGPPLTGMVNRLMCWTTHTDGRQAVEIAIGQRIAPLPVAPKP